MRKIIVLLWVVLLPITSILAQSNEEKQEVYDELKEWAVVKLTIAYMEDLHSWTENSEGIDSKEYETYKTFINNYKNFKVEEKINLEDIGKKLLNGDWKNTKTKVFDNYKLYVLDSITKFNYYQIPPYGYNENISKNSFNKTINVLNEEFIKQTYDNQVVNDNLVNDDLNEDYTEDVKHDLTLNTIPSLETKSSSIFSIVLKIIIGILFLLSLFRNYKIYSKNKDLKISLKRKTKEYDELFMTYSSRDNNHEKISYLNQQLENSNSVIKTLKSINETLQERIIKLEGNSKVSEKPSSILSSEPITTEIDLEVPKQHFNNIIYLTSPFQNSTFANEDASKEKTNDSIYQVEFNKQTLGGSLSIIEDSDLARALNSPDSYLETACIFDNEYFNNARGIKVLEKGEIKLEGEDWKVIKKVRIKFI